MAASAAATRASASWKSVVAMAMPMETPICTVAPSTRIGWEMAAIMRSATMASISRLSMPSTRTPNSSPPRRAAVSVSRTAEWMRSATSVSTTSPTWWPKWSFTGLKPSRSQNMSATVVP